MNTRRHILLTFFLMLFSFGYAHRIAVKNIDELNNANSQAQPGDTIVLKNGEWKDAIIKLSCNGSEGKPIIFMAETPGKVIITGKSQLKIGGSYIVVQGLYFTKGYSGDDQSVIDFRTDENLALINLVGVQVSSLTGNVFKKCNTNALLISFKDIVRARHAVSDNIIHASGTILTNKFVTGK